jgi:type IV pilus biogenesis/stability protein PilW
MVKLFFMDNMGTTKYIFFIFILLLLTSCVTTGTSDNIKKADAHYQIGLSYYNENDIQKAYIEFQKALELDPKNKDVLNAIGIINLLKFEDPQKAIGYFKKALLVDKNFSGAYNNLGGAYERIGRTDDAINSYKNALSNPMYKNPERAYNNLGMLYYRLGRYDDAIDAFKGSLRRVDNFYPSYYGLALSYNAKGFYGDASTAMARAIELDPLYKGDKEKAREDFENKKILAQGEKQKDLYDYLEILKY